MTETTMTMTVGGVKSAPFTIADMARATTDLKRVIAGRLPVKNTAADRAVSDAAFDGAADELRQFIERFEQLQAEKADIAAQQKEVMAEAKGRGYDTKILRLVIALRRRKPDDIAEEQAILELYKTALGMD